MNGKPFEIALYGKGGIGKSTICANLSAALALKGKRVLQIGCDPKHDSTRLLMEGRMLPTVLECLRDSASGEAPLSEVLGEGYLGIGCIEAGGPKPGIGCAGRGIISAFEFLEKKKVKERYDIVNYDVLGDVVCGGFAVPIRREYADAIFLVTSGEYMALYAANNILRGVRNYDGDKHRRIAGIIYNRRLVAGEDERVSRFAKATGLPVCAVVPRSDLFSKAEEEKKTVMELGTEGREREVFLKLAESISEDMPLFEALPLSDEDLERIVLGGEDFSPSKKAPDVKETPVSECDGCEEDMPRTDEAAQEQASRPPLYGCAFNGAATAAIHLTDAIVIAHSPKSCAFYTWQNISAPGRRNLYNRGILMPSAISPNFEPTLIDGHDVVFGAVDKLRSAVAAAMEKKPGAVIVISSCVSGIIGDDVLSTEEMSTDEIPVIVLPADGDISGDYVSGMDMCLKRIAKRLIDRNAKPSGKKVNIIGEYGVSNNTDVNYRVLKSWLDAMGIEIGCRFLGDATAAEVRDLLSAPLNILALDTPDNAKLKAWLEEEYGCVFFSRCLPVGYRATENFLKELGEFFGCEDRVAPVLEAERERYLAETEKYKEALKGKKVLMTTINTDIDWLWDTAEQAGAQFVWIGVLNYLRQQLRLTSDPSRKAVIHEIQTRSDILDAVEKYAPDIVITGYSDDMPKGAYVTDSLPMTQRVGFYSGIDVLDRWSLLLENRREGEWVNDREYFEKYFA
ncbi:MAG: AAA family ATPase [Firmicutes bacterium]|nr:AAA family ATPase [Bacillota bacterium]